MRINTYLGTALLLAAALYVPVSLPMPTPAHADAEVTDQLALARIGASECGLARCTEGELAAIVEVLRNRCPNCRLITIARQYSSRVFNPQRTDARAWIADLQPDGREPRGWPTEVRQGGGSRPHAPWSAYRGRWLALYAMAGRVLREQPPSACVGRVDHWGCPPDPRGVCRDHERALRAGWELVECAEGTRNQFWRIPR